MRRCSNCAMGGGTDASVASKIRSCANASPRITCADSSSRQGSAMSSGWASSTADGELGREPGPRQRRRARQLECRGRKLRQAPLDKGADGVGLRQPTRSAGHARQHHVLERLEREHRVAAGVLEQRRREPQPRRVRAAPATRSAASLARGSTARARSIRGDAILPASRARPRSPCRPRAGRCAKPQLSMDERVRLRQRLQELDAGVVGEVQVVDDHREQPRARGVGAASRRRRVAAAAAGLRRPVPRRRRVRAVPMPAPARRPSSAMTSWRASTARSSRASSA